MANQKEFDRRGLLRLGAAGGAVAGAAGGLALLLPGRGAAPGQAQEGAPAGPQDHAQMGTPTTPATLEADGEAGTRRGQQDHAAHSLSLTVGDVDIERLGFDPSVILRQFDYGEVSTAADGTVVREFEITAFDREIEIAPGVFFPAWTYNGQVPGPTLRANEGDRIRVRFTNAGSHPHTMHFHGIHSAFHDGVSGIGRGDILPGETFVYEFNAEPYGCHLYHCHSTPLKRHIHKGLYGAYIVNPDPARHGELARSRHPDHEEASEWDEMVMVMNAFDTTFDAANEVYAVNTVAFHYMKHPIAIDRTRPIRIYLINITEFDPLNSFHLHANFFNYYDTGTTLEPTLRRVDTIMQVQAQRGILEFDFRNHKPGLYMFHAHVSEFAELGWMGVFDVR
ncbi:MAG: multicopper oxidase domain-containing protein [Chloroflexia bacterium]|nr:multicopper oxidase domain-containing protein [Chloroflexia bacterium]